MKIVCDNQIHHAPFQALGHQDRQANELDLVDSRDISKDRVRDADVLVVRSVTSVNESLLASSRVRAVASATAGTDHIDTKWLKQQGIDFFYASGANAWAVAEYTLVCILLLAKEHHWDLLNFRVGIIGFGHVGTRLYKLLKPLGIGILVCDPYLEARYLHPEQVVGERSGNASEWFSYEQVLESDIISFHTPFTTTGAYPTHHLLSKKFLSLMPEHGCIINTARGGIQCHADLLEWADLHRHQLCLDVFEGEPEVDKRLNDLCLLATPHIAGYTVQAKERLSVCLRRQLDDWLDQQDATSSAAQPPPGADVNPNADLAAGVIEPGGNLLSALLQCTNPLRDSDQFASTLAASQPAQYAQAFRRVRQQYLLTPPARHEFAAWQCHPEDPRADILTQLGFASLSSDDGAGV